MPPLLSKSVQRYFLHIPASKVTITTIRKMSPNCPSSREVHPPKPGNIIRIALALESSFTVAVSAYYVFFPRHYLIHVMDAAPAQVTTTALQSTQQYGAVGILIGAGVGLFIPDTKAVVDCRQTLYLALLVFELLFIPLLLWQALRMEGGMPRHSLLTAAAQFVPFVVWRVFVLGWKPEWLGRSPEGKKLE